MPSAKRIGFFWGEEKITLVEFDKNAPNQVVVSPLGAKGTPSPFSSNLTEEIQITALLKKLLQDSHITGGAFYVSLPMKEIILRSFVIPFVKPDDISNAIKFEAKRYIPFDIQDLSYTFHTIPFLEGQTKRLQVIFFAARKEVLARYERIFKQVNMAVSYSEPYIVSLAKALLYRKEIKPTEHIAFLILDKGLGRICFIDKGVPQFIREFPVSMPSQPEETEGSAEASNLKIVNEVGNSFDFYTRQFNGDKIEQVWVSSDVIQKDLITSLEAELKLKISKFSPVISTSAGQSNDMDAIYAMGACVTPSIESLLKFNFIADKTPKPKFDSELITALKPYQGIILSFLMCGVFLIVVNVLFQMRLKLVQNEYNQITAQEGAFAGVTQDSLQSDVQQSTDKLAQYKNIRTKSDMANIILIVASHLPKGSLLTSLSVSYDQGDSLDAHVTIDMHGDVLSDDSNEQIAVVNQVYSDLKSDKAFSKYVGNVSLVSFNPETFNGRQATGFNIHCS